ncbi:hypothetical protein SAMN05443549_103306 [Flavobacterium fluvii]|uniref:Uncharacterized protein n=1 Tax=Flavobacterium fluvii TaxID=468056 RepID=A0A1M5J0B2_9FLAO|nr:hypothetical protein SAMN05443549_103306 [Flavobacterium fluvii]
MSIIDNLVANPNNDMRITYDRQKTININI